ncbi:bifunctional adenosylcobinamide kinase/adenosylcobinamide-phosphate guanylyltransferase [Fibrobacterales bacterium]|nr:bifunctional adenosylcobinamide kinase/adenosylcobinamide-phosphate guanylyltransferase [Fibrobacterales bacterium]
MIYYITGGERSGKSSYAQELALKLTQKPYYLATARVWDGDFEERVKRHISERDERWTTLEEEKEISKVDIQTKVVILDCITLWLTNWYMDSDYDVEHCLENCKCELEALWSQPDSTLIIISNEIGMGGIGANKMTRKFTELQGWINQYIAQKSDHATLMVSGLPLKLKGDFEI